MKSIDFLEHGGGGLVVRNRGTLVSLPDPRDLHYQDVLAILQFGYVPGTPGDMAFWKTDVVFNHWRASWDLPEFAQAQRLAYLVDHYRSAIAYDLQTHVHQDLGHLWRQRRWVLLLDLIDHLPGHSWYSATVAQDEEYAAMVADIIASKPDTDGESSGPSLVTFSPEVSKLTDILDAVRNVSYTLAVVNSERGKEPKQPEPSKRPDTALERAIRSAERRRREEKHRTLVARVLPHKR